MHNSLNSLPNYYAQLPFSLAYFNEFAGEFGQIFHRGKGKQLEFVRQVEKMMILDDNNNIGLNYIGVEAIFRDWKLYTKNKELENVY